MRKSQIQISKVYAAKVSGAIVPVQILTERGASGYTARNLYTKRIIHIKSAARLRHEWVSPFGGGHDDSGT